MYARMNHNDDRNTAPFSKDMTEAAEGALSERALSNDSSTSRHAVLGSAV